MGRPLELDIGKGRKVTFPRYTVFDELDEPMESSDDLEDLQKRYGRPKRLPVIIKEPKKIVKEKMRSKSEIQKLKQELEMLTGFIADYGTDQENEYGNFLGNVIDALEWVLGGIGTEDFKSDAYLDLAELYATVKEIEQRAGKKMESS